MRRSKVSAPSPVAPKQHSSSRNATGRRTATARAAGNHPLLEIGQAKLKVGPAGDVYEQEADKVSRAIVDSLRDRPSVASATGTDGVPRATPKRVSRTVQRRPVIGAEGGTVDAGTDAAIEGAKRSGAALATPLRRQMEDAFGADFSGVKVHAGPRAADLNDRIQARAFTVGKDIFFRDGVPDTASAAGQGLLAHELTHTLQQGGGAARQLDVIRRVGADEDVEQGEHESEESTTPKVVDPEAGPDSTDENGEEPVLQGVGEGGELPDSLVRSKGPDDRMKEDGPGGPRVSRTAAVAMSASSSAAVGIEVSGMGLGAHTAHVARVAKPSRRDAVKPGKVGVSWTNPGGKVVDAFGEESFDVKYSAFAWKLITKKGKKTTDYSIQVDFNLDVTCAWGVNAGGSIDVGSATDGVTADNYEQIVHDLTPLKVEKSWRAPRDVYWSQAICERHEKYHSTDDKAWASGPGKKVMLNYVKAHPVTLSEAERKDPTTVENKVKAVLDAGLRAMSDANFAFYSGGASSYYSYKGEERAFGDGKAPYQRLVAGVRKTGLKLKKEKDKAAKNPKASAGATVGSGSDTPPTLPDK